MSAAPLDTRTRRRRLQFLAFIAVSFLITGISGCISHPSTEDLIGIPEGSSVPTATDGMFYSCELWTSTYETWTSPPREFTCAKSVLDNEWKDSVEDGIPAGTSLKVEYALRDYAVDADYLSFAASAMVGGKKRMFFISDHHVEKLLGVTLRNKQ